jgi:hypothetical protein
MVCAFKVFFWLQMLILNFLNIKYFLQIMMGIYPVMVHRHDNHLVVESIIIRVK